MGAIMTWARSGSCAAATILLVAGCASKSAPKSAPAATSSAGDLTLAQVDALATRSLTAAGLYHVTTQMTDHEGDYSSTTAAQLWVDASRGVARINSVETVTSPVTETVPVAELFQPTRNVMNGHASPRTSCHVPSPAVGALLDCPGPVDTDATTVSQGSYLGKAAIVLVTSRLFSAEDSFNQTTVRLYLDPATALPFARTEDGTHHTGTVVPLHRLTTYRSESVPRSSVASDFFDPAALG